MKLTGRIVGSQVSQLYGKAKLELEINEKKELLSEIDVLSNAELLDIEIKKHYKKKSLSANAYAWVLLGKLAEKTRIPKNQIYKRIVKDMGGNTDELCIKIEALEKFTKEWRGKGIGWDVEITNRDSRFADVTIYYGSSTFDSEQESRFIDLIIQECVEQSINYETLEKAAYMEGLLQR